MTMSPKAILVFSGEPSRTDLCLYKFVCFMGIECQKINLCEYRMGAEAFRAKVADNLCMMASAKTMVKLLGMFDHKFDVFKNFLFNNLNRILVYDLYPDKSLNSIVFSLTNGAVGSIEPIPQSGLRYKIASEHRSICGTFSGLVVGPININTDFGLEFDPKASNIANLVSIGRKSIFMKVEQGNCNLFLLACKKIIDINTRASRTLDIRACFSQIAPVLMFLKDTFKRYIWHNEQKHACLIIDDPLLKPAYGFLQYENLLKTMDKYGFCTSIAFIPWNYNRSDKRVLKIFAERSDKYSICIHGCDHIAKEFVQNNFDELNSKAILARARMQEHFEESRVAFDNIMVFPQGAFSAEAMRVLKSNDFVAAVNTEVVPCQSDTDGIELSQLLTPAITSYAGFPLFTRRYPSDEVPNFAFDLFVGKPCLIVAHHDFFKKGYEKVGLFIRRINAVDSSLTWNGLEGLLSKTYLQKYLSEDNIAVKIFSKKCLIENISKQRKVFHISKQESKIVPIKDVYVNNKKMFEYEVDGNKLQLILELRPREKVLINIFYKNLYPQILVKKNFNYRAKTALRRYLSELRDNVLSKNQTAQMIMKKLRK